MQVSIITDYTYTYNYIYKTDLRPSLLFLIMHKVLSSHKIFIKLDYILKNLGTCIDYNN